MDTLDGVLLQLLQHQHGSDDTFAGRLDRARQAFVRRSYDAGAR